MMGVRPSLSMSTGVPWGLVRLLRDLPPDHRKRSKAQLIAAGFIVYNYLGMDLFGPDGERSSIFDADTENERDARLTIIADSLFDLRNHAGFDEMCRRMRGRDLRPTFFELYTARSFAAQGYEIFAKPEISSKGSDFDFEIRQLGTRINVEVTALKSDAAATIKSALAKKRKQLPPDLPSVIAVYLPRGARGIQERFDELNSIADRFLRGTRRVNYVYFFQEKFMSLGRKCSWSMLGMSRKNTMPRVPSLLLNRTVRRGDPNEAQYRSFHDNFASLNELANVSELARIVDAELARTA